MGRLVAIMLKPLKDKSCDDISCTQLGIFSAPCMASTAVEVDKCFLINKGKASTIRPRRDVCPVCTVSLFCSFDIALFRVTFSSLARL